LDAMGRHDGTYNGTVSLGSTGAITGDSGTAASFDGAGYGSVPFFPALGSTAFTLECWARTGDLAHNLCAVSSHYSTKGCYFQSASQVEGQWEAGVGAGGADYFVASTTPSATMQSNGWVHLVMTFDSLLRFYIDGQWDRTAYFNFDRNGAGPFIIGGRGGSSSVAADLFWKGDIDEVAYYTNALSPAQIQAHYAAGRYGTNTAPVFKLQPQSQTVLIGTSNLFQVRVEGSS